MPVRAAHGGSCKVTLLGASGVGKSALLSQLTQARFVTEHQVDFGYRFGSFTHSEYADFPLQLWDVGGRYLDDPVYRTQLVAEEFDALSAIVLVYDVTRRATLNHLSKCLNEARWHCDRWAQRQRRSSSVDADSGIMPPVVVLGNKVDAAAEGAAAISSEEGEAWARLHGCELFFEVSATSHEQVEAVFRAVCAVVRERTLSDEATPAAKNNTLIVQRGPGFTG